MALTKADNAAIQDMIKQALGPTASGLSSINQSIATIQSNIDTLQKGTNNTNTQNLNLFPNPSTPPTVEYDNPANINKDVKIATSNLFVDTTPLSVSDMANLIFQNFSTSELITNTSNVSLIGGGTQGIISNIAEIYDRFSSYNLSRIPDLPKSDLNINNFIPTSGAGANGATVYILSTEPSKIVIEVNNINNELVEYQVITQSTVLDATI